MTAPPGNDPAAAPSRDIRILIVEDHRATGKAVTALLQATLGHRTPGGRAMCITTARDAENALESVTAAPPDVLIMDISLPGMNGIEAAARLRDIAPTLPVIIHTRNDSDVYRAMAARAGVRAFVSKQDTASQLPAALRGILDEILPAR